MNDIKESISNKEIIYNIKPKDIFDNLIRKAIKRRKDEEPIENDNHIIIKNEPLPNFINLKSSIYRNINKNIPKDIENLDEIPIESEYYKTLTRENFYCIKMIICSYS